MSFDDYFSGEGFGGGSSAEFEVTVKAASGKALLCRFAGGFERWVPRSQIEAGTTVRDQGDEGTLVVSAWLAGKWDEEGTPEGEPGVAIEGCTVLRETDKALHVRIPGQQTPLWLPKSQVRDESVLQHEGDVGSLVISPWLADQKGLTGTAVAGSSAGPAVTKAQAAKGTVEDDLFAPARKRGEVPPDPDPNNGDDDVPF